MKGICENIDGYTAQGVAVDLGLLYDLPVENLNLGFTVKNLGVQTKAFIKEKHDLPLVCNLGLGYMLLSNSLRLGLDLSQPEEGDFGVNVGGEYIWREMVSLRLGYKSMGEDLKTGSNKDGLTGFGIGLGVNMNVYYLDYAFVPFNELGDTHRVSIGMKWGGERVEDKSFRLFKKKSKVIKKDGINAYRKGQKYCKAKKYEASIKEYTKAIKEGYKTAKVYSNMGYCYYKLGKKEWAIKYYTKALKLDPDNEKIKKNLDAIERK